MRLDRTLSHAASLTRSEAQRAIRAGEVSVDGDIVRDPGAPVSAGQRILWRGVAVKERSPRYLMMYKPAGYVCVNRDAHHPGVLDLLPPQEREGLHAAGRLDADTTGLILLTDDGGWSHRVTSPRRKCTKAYRVLLAEPLADDAEAVFEAGVLLHGEDRKTRPARLTRVSETEVILSISEGKYHQVKRMFAAVGNHVRALHRERVGAIALDPALAPGEWRPLTALEVASVDSCPTEDGMP